MGTTREDFFLRCAELEFARKKERSPAASGVFFLRGERRLCASASLPVRLSLGGSRKKKKQPGFGECRSSVENC